MEREIASRLPRHQKRDTFFISYLAYEKNKSKKEVKSAEEGDGELLGTVQRSENV